VQDEVVEDDHHGQGSQEEREEHTDESKRTQGFHNADIVTLQMVQCIWQSIVSTRGRDESNISI
jgi:hypothetical protein